VKAQILPSRRGRQTGAEAAPKQEASNLKGSSARSLHLEGRQFFCLGPNFWHSKTAAASGHLQRAHLPAG